MYCSRCGTQNDDASKFCRSCGLDLSHTTPVAAVRDQQIDVTELDLVREQLKDEYEILEELGRGGMAIVFKAREKQLERDVAIKVLPFSLAFDKDGLAVVTDFGIAKAASGGKLTGTGMSIGTPHYMSPEQARAQALDGRSDIYSLGVVAYQSLIGRVPFDGEDSFSIGYKHIMEEIPTPPLETYDQRTTFEIVKKMMAKSPDERFQSADDLVQALEAGGGFSPVGVPTPPPTTTPPPPGGRVAPAPPTPPPRGSRKPPAAGQPKPPVAPGVAPLVVVVAVGPGA